MNGSSYDFTAIKNFFCFQRKIRKKIGPCQWYRLEERFRDKYNNYDEYCEDWVDAINKEPFVLVKEEKHNSEIEIESFRVRGYSPHFSKGENIVECKQWTHDELKKEFRLFLSKINAQLEFDF